MRPRQGQRVQVSCDGRDLLGEVFMTIDEPSVVLHSPSGRLFVVPIKGSTFTVDGGGSGDEVPLGEPPPDHG